MILKLNNGKEITIEWAGVASLDGILRIGFKGGDILKLTNLFADKNNLPVTIFSDGEPEGDFSRYTNFFGVSKRYDGSLTVSLAKE